MKETKTNKRPANRGGGERSHRTVHTVTILTVAVALLATAMFVSSFYTASDNEINDQYLSASDDGIVYAAIDAATASARWDKVTLITEVEIADEVMISGTPRTVTEITLSAFENCISLESIIIPSSVEVLGQGAFGGCTNLKSVSIPDGVEIIGAFTFRNCTALESVDMPSSLKSIGAEAFSNCSELTSIEIPEGTESIGNQVFRNCTGLVSVTLPSTLTTIGTQVFRGCTSMTAINVDSGNSNFSSPGGVLFAGTTLLEYPGGKAGPYTIPEGTTALADRAFIECEGLTSIHIPSSLTSIGVYAFVGCESLASVTVDENSDHFCVIDGVLFDKEAETLIFCPVNKEGDYTIPDTVKTIGFGAFWGCIGLTSVTAPSAETIGENAFYECYGLLSVSAPSAATIGTQAFRFCESLEHVDISNAESIGRDAFFRCDNLAIVTLPEDFTGDLEDIRLSEDAVKVFLSGNYVSASATIDGTFVTLNIVTEEGMGVTSIKVGTESGEDDIYEGFSWTFDIEDNKIVYVLITCDEGSTITVAPSAGGYYQYRLGDDEEWIDVTDGRIFVPAGESVEIRGIAYSGYVFAWTDELHRDFVDGDTISFTPTGNGTIHGTFSSLSVITAEVVLVIAALALFAILAAGYFVYGGKK